MSRRRIGLFVAIAAGSLSASAVVASRAQERKQATPPPTTRAATATSVQDALLKPFHFTFRKPTPLDEAARQLGRALDAPVAVDRAALDRLGLKVDDPVQLELEGVRLKTGLKLLLDQLDLTYKVVAEDNMLVITDATGSSDPIDQVLVELKELHRDLHDTQDAVDEIRAALGLDAEGGPKMHKPTIIEEMPSEPGEKPKKKDPPAATPPSRSRPGF